jgi:phosphate transport system permease protein
MENTSMSTKRRKNTQSSNLQRKSHVGEALIRAALFIFGALSIFTTVGIVYVLGTESIAFFTRQLWENSNQTLTVDIEPFETVISISETGTPIEPGDTIRLGDEVMLVETHDGGYIQVIRGTQDTEPEPHTEGAELFVANRVTLTEFFTNTNWIPQIGEFGILPLVTSTLITSTIAMLVALPLGLGVAIYLSEYASQRARGIIKPVLEILAGIPTVVYGYFALTFMTPLLRSILGNDVVEVYNTASAGIVIGVLILPFVSSISEDALSAVPRSLREAAYGLGATRLETAITVVLPAAISGLAAAAIVATSRAIGETMIVSIAAGAGPAFTFNPFESAETMTGHIVRISGGDLSYDSIDYNSIFAIALVLFLMTLSLNLISQRVVRRFREVYE